MDEETKNLIRKIWEVVLEQRQRICWLSDTVVTLMENRVVQINKELKELES